MAALALAAVATFWPPLIGAGGADGPLLLLGCAGWLLLAAALAFPAVTLVAPAIVVFGVAFALSLSETLDGRAPLYAGLLLLIAELSYWALDLRVPIAAEEGTLRVRGVAVGLSVAGGIALAAALLALTAVRVVPGGVAWEVAGVVAAASALALVVALARPRA